MKFKLCCTTDLSCAVDLQLTWSMRVMMLSSGGDATQLSASGGRLSSSGGSLSVWGGVAEESGTGS